MGTVICERIQFRSRRKIGLVTHVLRHLALVAQGQSQGWDEIRDRPPDCGHRLSEKDQPYTPIFDGEHEPPTRADAEHPIRRFFGL